MATHKSEIPGSGISELPAVVNDDTVIELVQTLQEGVVLFGRESITPAEKLLREQAVLAETVLFNQYRGLVPYLAKTVFHRRETDSDYDDFIQFGSIGIIGSLRRTDISRFDDDYPSRSLSSYVIYGIRRGMRAALAESRIIKTPFDSAAVMSGSRDGLPKGRSSELRQKMLQAQRPIPLESGRSFGTSREWTNYEGLPVLKLDPIDTLTADNGYEDGWLLPENFGLVEILNNAIGGALSEKERWVLVARFTLDKTLEETGHDIGVTKERVRQIEMRALIKLRRPELRAQLTDYLPSTLRFHNDPYGLNVVSEPSQPEMSFQVHEALIGQLNHIIFGFRAYESTPRTIKQIVNGRLQQVAQMINKGMDPDDIVDVLAEEDDEDKYASLLESFSTEQELYDRRRAEIAERIATLPTSRREAYDLEQSIKIDQQLTKELSYGSERFEAHIQKLKGKHVELERLLSDIEEIMAITNDADIDRWLRHMIRHYNLPPRLYQAALSNSLRTMHRLAETLP